MSKKQLNKKIAVLNFAGDLGPELQSYFARKNIVMLSPDEGSHLQDVTHLLVKGEFDFNSLADRFQVRKQDIRIISLSPVDHFDQFVESNGRLVLDEVWMQNSLGPFILDKFFQEYGGISLEDNYPVFQEEGTFKITNPFSTGDYLDRLVYSSFENGMSGLSVKTYFDHIIMYLTGLKTQGKLGYPIEVTYGLFEETFGVQLHFYTQDLFLQDVASSLSENISKHAEKYLLNIAVKSSDFFDFTVLTQVNKTVITALWTKDDKIKTENKGMLFNELSEAATLTQYPTKGVTSFQLKQSELNDLSEKIILPASSQPHDANQKIKGSSSWEEDTTTVRGQSEDEDDTETVGGDSPWNNEKTIVSDSSQNESEESRTVKGSANEEGFSQTIKEEMSRADELIRIKSLKEPLSEQLEVRFKDFLADMAKDSSESTEEDLKSFRDNELKKTIKNVTNKLQSKLVGTIGPLKVTDEDLQSSSVDGHKLRALMADNQGLQAKIKILLSEVKILKASRAQLASIRQQAFEAMEKSQKNLLGQTKQEGQRGELLQKLRSNTPLDKADVDKISSLLELDGKELQNSLGTDINYKKLQLEHTKRESFYSQELEKNQRILRSKDLMIEKMKENIALISSKKNNEIEILNEKLNRTNKMSSLGGSDSQASHIKDLERKLANSDKMVEIYKNNMVENSASLKDENRRILLLNKHAKTLLDSSKLEITKFQDKALKDTYVINNLKSEKAKLEQALKKNGQETKKAEVMTSDNQLQEQEVKKMKNLCAFYEEQIKESQIKQRELESKLSEAIKNQKKEILSDEMIGKGKISHLETNLRKLTQDLIESRNMMGEMKKEANKLRQDKISLQNQLDKVKKDSEKAKSAAPKKPGMGGKAA